MQGPFSFPESLRFLDLHSNQLEGNIPALPQYLFYLDLPSNNFTSIPYNSFNERSGLRFLSLSNNSLTGVIREHICAVPCLYVLDLSRNNLSGSIPTCLLEDSTARDILNLRKNNIEGPSPDVFPRGCTLKVRDLNGNFFEGEVPKSLTNCSGLEFLDLGHNELIGKFPCLLKNISTLHVFVPRSNKLFGSIECLDANGSWPIIHIFDLAQKNFNGELPKRWMTNLQAMTAKEVNAYSAILHLRDENVPPNMDFIKRVTVTSKGLEMELPKILTIFTYIDLSRNNFHGPIPTELGQLRALHTLNLSYNDLSGQIPSSIGNLQNLESLDLSWNSSNATTKPHFPPIFEPLVQLTGWKDPNRQSTSDILGIFLHRKQGTVWVPFEQRMLRRSGNWDFIAESNQR